MLRHAENQKSRAGDRFRDVPGVTQVYDTRLSSRVSIIRLFLRCVERENAKTIRPLQKFKRVYEITERVGRRRSFVRSRL